MDRLNLSGLITVMIAFCFLVCFFVSGIMNSLKMDGSRENEEVIEKMDITEPEKESKEEEFHLEENEVLLSNGDVIILSAENQKKIKEFSKKSEEDYELIIVKSVDEGIIELENTYSLLRTKIYNVDVIDKELYSEIQQYNQKIEEGLNSSEKDKYSELSLIDLKIIDKQIEKR